MPGITSITVTVKGYAFTWDCGGPVSSAEELVAHFETAREWAIKVVGEQEPASQPMPPQAPPPEEPAADVMPDEQEPVASAAPTSSPVKQGTFSGQELWYVPPSSMTKEQLRQEAVAELERQGLPGGDKLSYHDARFDAEKGEANSYQPFRLYIGTKTSGPISQVWEQASGKGTTVAVVKWDGDGTMQVQLTDRAKQAKGILDAARSLQQTDTPW